MRRRRKRRDAEAKDGIGEMLDNSETNVAVDQSVEHVAEEVDDDDDELGHFDGFGVDVGDDAQDDANYSTRKHDDNFLDQQKRADGMSEQSPKQLSSQNRSSYHQTRSLHSKNRSSNLSSISSNRVRRSSTRRRLDDDLIPSKAHFRFRNPFALEMGELTIRRIRIRCECNEGNGRKGHCKQIVQP